MSGLISKRFLIHLLFMLLGYALAVLTATTVVCIFMGLPTVFPDQGAWGSFQRYLKDLPMIFAFGMMMTATYGLPGWLISAVTGEIRNERHKYWFALAGLLTALLAHMLSGWVNYTIFADIFMSAAILAGGLCGGLAYWGLTGRRSGSWKRVATQRFAVESA
jgi:energy-converting hydrogenase Eha subunit A